MSSNNQSNPADAAGTEQTNGRGILIVVSSPSGGGKGTLIRKTLKVVPDLGYSVSYTTRAPRIDEVAGQHYFFASVEEFRAMETAGEFLESAVVHGNYYGTALARVEEELSKGRDTILEIDVQGADNVRRLVRDAVMIFVLPPSYEVLSDRLTARGSERPDDRALRLRNARHEVEAYSRFDYVIINDNADRAANQLASIVFSERARRERQEATARRVLESFSEPAKHDG
jgi:guanylate kinase